MIITKAEDTFLETLKTTPLETLVKCKNFTRFVEELQDVDLDGCYIHPADKNHTCAKIGRLPEILFEEGLYKSGRVFEYADKDDQIRHIDFTITRKDGTERTIDVKAPKRNYRGGLIVNPSIIWVEFINRQGGKGWLYGKCNFFAFYQPLNNGFYVVRRTDLVGLCEELCSTEYVTCSKDAMYNLYQKENALDATSIIKFTDLQKIPYFVYSLGDDFWDDFSVKEWQKAHPKKAA